jgi:hypothetical protein
MTGDNRYRRCGRRLYSRRGSFTASLVLLVWLWLFPVGQYHLHALEALEGVTIPDTSYARRAVLDVLTVPAGAGRRAIREIIRVPGGDAVLHRTDAQNENIYHLFIPAVDDELETASPGTYIVRRRESDGAFDQIKIFLQRHEGSFIRLFPNGRTLRMDVFIAGEALFRDVPVAMSMERALTAPTETILTATSGVVDWSVLDVDPHAEGYRTISTMVERIRRAIPYLPDAEDGAMDAEGNLVFIESLLSQERLPGFNCSGFAKWVVDGLYGPRTGSFLSLDILKEKHLDYRGTSWSRPLEDARDPYFGLDWTRNLAVQMEALNRGVDPDRIHPESMDVRNVSVATYTEDVGYRVDSLIPVLYWLARHEPGTFYLGSINRLFGSDPVLRQHTHVVVFFPYFDETGRFQVAVMERNVETGIASLQRRYGKDHVHLVRLRGGTDFRAPLFSNVPDNTVGIGN